MLKGILFIFFTVWTCLQAGKPVEFVVVIPSYNNEKWCIKNIESVVKQTYPHWSLIYINDCSTDKTGVLIERYIEEKKLQAKCKVIHNFERKGAMENYYNCIMNCPEGKIIATVDGDDRLAHTGVLERLARIYSEKNVWCTHGNYTTEPFTDKSYCTAYPSDVLKANSFRKQKWFGCQLRTFYARLFHLIDKKDLKYNNAYVPMASDVAFMLPILEMASDGHIFFVQEPIYVVNTANPISDVKKDPKLQKKIDDHIRNQRKYEPLKKLF